MPGADATSPIAEQVSRPWAVGRRGGKFRISFAWVLAADLALWLIIATGAYIALF